MRQGYSLIELAVVLMVGGLIVGGVVAGADLIRQYEVKSLVEQVKKYETAIASFQLKYGALPGDFLNATDYWGEADATPADCYTTASTSTETCNGNGDGIILSADGLTTASESFRAWQHLANSGILPGNYTGVAGSDGIYDGTAGTNVPESAAGGGCALMYLYSSDNDTESFSGYWDQQYVICGDEATDGALFNPILTPVEIMSIDTKIDDGYPGTGIVYGTPSGSAWGSNCSTTDDPTTAEYSLTLTDRECPFIIVIE